MKIKILVFFLISLIGIGQSKKLSQPEKDFEIFWETFKNNYAFFQLKKVNWDSTYAKYRPLVSKSTKQNELINILGEMVKPLNDSHIIIAKGDKILFNVKKPSYFKKELKGIEANFWPMVYKTLENNNFSKSTGIGPTFRNENLYYSAENPDVGYIRITRFFAEVKSIFDDKKEAKDTQLMLTLFEDLLTKFASKKSIVIDIRGNGGGHGGVELASRFANEKTLTHYKSIKTIGNYESFLPLEPQYLTPNNGVKYLKPIIILTNDRSASSAEDFVISLYNLKNVTTIGTNTSGMLSDMFEAKLSKGVSFTLSNQRYYSVDNQLLEDVGIAPKIIVQNTKNDIINQKDPVVTKAIEISSMY